MSTVNKINVNGQTINIGGSGTEVPENITANDVAYDSSTQYDENTVGKEINNFTENIKFHSTKIEDEELCFTSNDDSEVYVKINSNGIYTKNIFNLDGKLLSNDNQDIKYWAVIGDSITNANHDTIEDIDINDPFMPFDGYTQVSTYKRKNYAYYISKRNNFKWANYGWGGTTITHCHPKGHIDCNGFVDNRMYSLKEGIEWDFITIFFGWNDFAYGPLYQRDLWLQEQYNIDIGYPYYEKQIDTEGFATQEQKNACDNAHGIVNDVEYNNSSDYFFAKFLGNINSIDPNTWYGAWNIVLDYYLKTFKKAKIMIVVPFATSSINHKKAIEAVKNIASKYSISYFDFEELPWWYFKQNDNTITFKNPDDVDGYWYTIKNQKCAPKISGYNQSRLSVDTLHPSNLGYLLMSYPFENALLNK